MPRLVVEIGTEELPPRFFPSAMAQLQEGAAALLERLRLTHGQVHVLGTPRRLALVVENVAAQQAAAVREERGPSAKVAFDKEGKPTKAAEGFARRHGLTAPDLVVKQTDGGEYVFAVVHEPEAPAPQALAAALPDLISGLSFPKSMRWGSTALRFGRPVRWVLALLGEEVIRFRLADLQSGREARGHPVLADGMFPVPSAEEYEGALERHSVIVDPERRRAALAQQLADLAEAQDAAVMDDGLLEETVYLVEWPTCGLGSFDPAFLRLPRPVLVEEMRHVQSYFPLQNAAGELIPGFIAVRDGGGANLEGIIRGWEHVLVAKLIDASFFYEQDLKRPLAERVEDLRGVVFQEKLGTMYEKVVRLRRIAEVAAGQMAFGAVDIAQLARAVLLAKADLTTEVVTDMSGLQGTMGREYALASGEPAEVAEAIGEHYRPRFAGDAIPQTQLGRGLALADKLDNITALFAVGAIPSGSADPYGLRRDAAGVLNIGLVLAPPVHLGDLVDEALAEVATQVELSQPASVIRASVMDFIGQRLDTYLREELGVRYDLADAVLSSGFDDLGAAAARAHALQAASAEPEFLPAVMAATRVANIVTNFPGGEVDPSRFQEESERTLWSAYQAAVPAAEAQVQGRDYTALFRTLASLRGIIDRYFEDVLVMAEDEAVRSNRLATVSAVNQLMRRLADFTKVVQT